jgi:hypothetical protein
MHKKLLRSLTLVLVIGVSFSVVALAVSLRQQSSASHVQTKEKTLKEIAAERDVEVPEGSESSSEYERLEELNKDAVAIVYGRIIDSKSFFDETSPLEYGDFITTEYTVDVYRVLRNTRLKYKLEPGQATPAPLITPLKIARNGGVVEVNGHKATVKVKGYDSMKPGKQYIFFLFWSTAYKAYVLAGGASGVVMVNDDRSLTPLASSEAIKEKLRGMDLESFIGQLDVDR